LVNISQKKENNIIRIIQMKKHILALLLAFLAVPAVQAAQASEDEVKVRAAQVSQEDEVDVCAICHAPLANPIALPCGHNNKFHSVCFIQYTQAQAQQGFPIACPMCRKDVLAGLGGLEAEGDAFDREDAAFNNVFLQPIQNRLLAAADDRDREHRLPILQNAVGRLQVARMLYESRLGLFATQEDLALTMMEQRSPIVTGAPYVAGLALGLGFLAKAKLRWKWNVERSTDNAFLGSMIAINSGLQLYNLYKNCPANVSQGWRNNLEKVKNFARRNKLQIVSMCAALGCLGAAAVNQRREARQANFDFLNLGLSHEPQLMLNTQLVGRWGSHLGSYPTKSLYR
jgi:hypothetical protein